MNENKIEKNVSFGVVIVTFNRLNLLKECLDNVLNQTLPFDLITVVDNCSSDGTREFLDDSFKNTDNDTIIVVHTEENIGGAGGFSLGIRESYKYVDYLLLIDDDAIIDTLFLEKITGCMEEEVYAYSGTVLTNNEIDLSHRRVLTDKIFLKKRNVLQHSYDSNSFYYDLSSFCGLVFSTKLIDKIGFPLAEYFIWYDDTEYSMRIRKFTSIKNINSAHINHKTLINSDSNLSWKSYYGYRNFIDMGKRHSRFPLLFVTYRLTYHFIRFIQYWAYSILTSDNVHYANYSKLHKNVITDTISGKLGLSEDFLPGTKI